MAQREGSVSRENDALEQLRRLRLAVPAPRDFEAFWRGTARELALVEPEPLEIQAGAAAGEPQPTGPTAARFHSWEGRSIHAFFSPRRGRRPGAPSSRPLLVTCHGYGGEADPERVRRLSTFGVDVVSFDARGFGRSQLTVPLSRHGYILTGIEDPQRSILRGAVCDFIQARRAAERWFGTPSDVAFEGFSFAGGLATMAAAVLHLVPQHPQLGPALSPPSLLAIGAPTFGDHRTRIRLCEAGSGKEVAHYLELYPERREQVLGVLGYFDTAHFAPFVHSKVILGIGRFDPIVPAPTVYPIKNALPKPPVLFELPCSHTSEPEEREWIRWESRWIRELRRLAKRAKQAVDGTPGHGAL